MALAVARANAPAAKAVHVRLRVRGRAGGGGATGRRPAIPSRRSDQATTSVPPMLLAHQATTQPGGPPAQAAFERISRRVTIALGLWVNESQARWLKAPTPTEAQI